MAEQAVSEKVGKMGMKSSEFWVAAAVIVPWLLKSLGLDAWIPSPEKINQVAEAVKQGNVSDMPIVIAGLYIAGRIYYKRNG